MSVQRRSEEHTSELQSRVDLVCRLLLEKKKWWEVDMVCDKGGLPAAASIGGRRPDPAVAASRRARAVFVCLAGGRGGEDGFFFNDAATTEIYTLSLHDALPI